MQVTAPSTIANFPRKLRKLKLNLIIESLRSIHFNAEIPMLELSYRAFDSRT